MHTRSGAAGAVRNRRRVGLAGALLALLSVSPLAGVVSPQAHAAARACDDTLKSSFKPDADTRVTQVMAFKKGDDLAPSLAQGKALEDLCLVRLLVGPGNPGPADAASTSPGIGIELWLPTEAKWNGRFHALGGGGMSGRLGDGTLLAEIAGSEGAVSAFTDVGHKSYIGTKFEVNEAAIDVSFLLGPDGKVSKYHWAAAGHVGIHEMAVKSKAFIKHFYGRPQKYSYFVGGSNGGRQGHVNAQTHPEDFDGIVSGAPAINWDKLMVADLYPVTIMLHDLGRPLRPEQINLASAAALSACDATVTGEHDGFITDLAACRYDPVKDKSVLCAADGGTNQTPACVTRREAAVINKIWYGQTADGSAPDPAKSNGQADRLDPGQVWYGLPRGTALIGLGSVAESKDGEVVPMPHSSRWIPVVLQDPAFGPPDVRNATGNGKDGWKTMTFADLVRAETEAARLEKENGAYFGNSPDLSAFKKRGGKLLVDHGVADQLIALPAMNHYFRRLVETMGGLDKVQEFYRYYQVPGMDHGGISPLVAGLPGVSPAPDPLGMERDEMYRLLVNWVEKGVAPETIVATSKSKAFSRPLCLYPKTIAYSGGDKTKAESYTCK